MPRVSIDLGRRLIAAGVVPPEEVEAALFLSCVRGVPFARVLLDRGALSARALEDELERVGGLGLRQVVGSTDLVARLPRAMCRRLAALPVRVDNVTGTVDVVAADPLDAHLAAEFGFHLGAPIRVLRASIAAIEEAIRRLELDDQTHGPGRSRRVTPPFPHGAPQSSNPPPVAEEAPIPLVRRIALPPRDAYDDDNHDSDDPPMPLRKERLGRFNTSTGAELPAVSFPSEPPDDPGGPGRTLRPEMLALLGSSTPRPFGGRGPENLTPPYGSPVLAPQIAAFDPDAALSERGAARRTARPSLLADLADLQPASGPGPRYAGDPEGTEPDPEGAAPEPLLLRAPDGDAVLDALRRVTNRDEVVRLALRGLHLIAPRFGVFAVKRDGFQGWACNVELGDQDEFRGVRIPLDQPSILATAAATSLYLGPIPSTPAHAPLLALMGHSSADVAAIAVRAGGRPALVLLADELEDTLLGTRFLDELAKAVGEALSRLLGTRG